MKRRGAISRVGLLFLVSLALLAGLVAWMAWEGRARTTTNSSADPLVVYCAAGIKIPFEEAAREYEQAYGVAVQAQFGGSGTQLSNAEASHIGDLFMPVDDSYIQLARKKGLLDEALPLATTHPVLAVRKGNPKGLHSLDDVLRPDVKLAQANPDAAGIGKLTKAALEKAGLWEKVKGQIAVFKPTVNDVANDVKIGSVDGGFIWDTTVLLYPELEGVEIPAFNGVETKITVGVLKSSKQPAAALRFARYLAARDKGLKAFERHGFHVVEGDLWSDAPEIRLLAGAMLRPAIEETISAFEQREGCRVTRVYNGCGILVAQMKAGERPDAYFACDSSFMRQVNDLFLDQAEVSTNRLVIVVPKGNPHAISTLKDLTKPGVRVGVGHEKQCALGALTQKTFDQSGLREAVSPNIVVQSPTGDMLVNALRTGSLDAVVAYVSNTTTAKNEVETIPIDVPCAIATQPLAVGRESKQKYITGRLLDALESKQSKDRFESQGFAWTLGAREATVAK
ncbi:MAG: putative binding protein precursor [Phycisphaerales bacterium]|nr:putative binding protein precursor [Phycisphaerales bacterium]